MGQITESRLIDGFDVKTTQLPPMQAYKLMIKVAGIIMPIIGQLAPAIDDGAGGMTLSDDNTKILPALAGLFASLGEAEAETLALAILRSTLIVVDGRALSLVSTDAINVAFAGRLKTMLLCMKFSLEVNFRDFFSGSGSPAQATPTP